MRFTQFLSRARKGNTSRITGMPSPRRTRAAHVHVKPCVKHAQNCELRVSTTENFAQWSQQLHKILWRLTFKGIKKLVKLNIWVNLTKTKPSRTCSDMPTKTIVYFNIFGINGKNPRRPWKNLSQWSQMNWYSCQEVDLWPKFLKKQKKINVIWRFWTKKTVFFDLFG